MQAPKPLLLTITLTLSALALGLTLTGSSQATLLPYPAGPSGVTVPRVAPNLAWLTEHLDAPKISADMSCRSLRLDSAGNPRIGYFRDHPIHKLQYAGWMGSAWDLQTVDSEGWVGRDTSLALDSADNPHVSYYDFTNRDLKYARWTGSTWHLQIVDGTGDVGGYTSLALDSADNPHVSYYDWLNADLKYARWTGSAWDLQTVDSEGWVGRDASLALDNADNPHIIYSDGSNEELKYARWTGSAWDIQTVKGFEGQFGDYGWFESIALALDSGGNPHVSYMYCESLEVPRQPPLEYASIEYARWTDSTWDIRILATSNTCWGHDTSLALDTAGNPHITYYDGNDLQYAHWTGDAWDIQTVDSAGYYGWHTSLALDSAGNPNISYYDWYNGDLKYARWAEGAWDLQTVDSDGDVGEDSAIAVDSAGKAHISYHDDTNKDLKYAQLVPPLLVGKNASIVEGLRNNDTLTYTLTLSGPGLSVRLWDPLPDNVSYVSGTLTGTVTPPAVYSPAVSAVVWQGALPTDTASVVYFQVTPGITGAGSLSLSLPIVNTAWLTDTDYGRTVSATVIVNAERIYIPLTLESN